MNPYIPINAAVANGVNSGSTVPEFTPFCPGAKCNWPDFSSLDLCSSCRDVTDYAKNNWNCQQNSNTTRACTYRLPNSGFNYTYITAFTNTSALIDREVGGELRQRIWTTMMTQTETQANTFLLLSRVVMENTGVLVPGRDREQIHDATECTFSMCVVQHRLAVDHGVTVHEKVGSIERPFIARIVPVSNSSVQALNVYDIKPATVGGIEYTVDGQSTLGQGLVTSLDKTLSGNVTMDYMNRTKIGGVPYVDGGIQPSSDLSSFFYSSLNFTSSVENIASSVSAYMHSLSPHTITGNSLSTETYIRVRWAWLSFPVVLVAGGVLLLALAMLETRNKGVEVWKYSCLPLLFHGIGNGGAQRLGTTFSDNPKDTIKEMEEDSRRIRVRLDRGGSNGAWMLHREQG